MGQRRFKQLPIPDIIAIVISLILIGTPFWLYFLIPKAPTPEDVEQAVRALEAAVRSGRSLSEYYSQRELSFPLWAYMVSDETRRRLVEALTQRVGGWGSCVEVAEFTQVLKPLITLVSYEYAYAAPKEKDTMKQRYKNMVNGLETVLLDVRHPECVKRLWSAALRCTNIRTTFVHVDFLRSHFLRWVLEALKKRLIKLEDVTEVQEISFDPTITQTPELEQLLEDIRLMLKEYEESEPAPAKAGGIGCD